MAVTVPGSGTVTVSESGSPRPGPGPGAAGENVTAGPNSAARGGRSGGTAIFTKLRATVTLTEPGRFRACRT
jgi:hypothetical protein